MFEMPSKLTMENALKDACLLFGRCEGSHRDIRVNTNTHAEVLEHVYNNLLKGYNAFLNKNRQRLRELQQRGGIYSKEEDGFMFGEGDEDFGQMLQKTAHKTVAVAFYVLFATVVCNMGYSATLSNVEVRYNPPLRRRSSSSADMWDIVDTIIFKPVDYSALDADDKAFFDVECLPSS